jgi:hypothetical protein
MQDSTSYEFIPLSCERRQVRAAQSASKRLRIAKHQAAAATAAGRSPSATRRKTSHNAATAAAAGVEPQGSVWERNERAALRTTEAIMYGRMVTDPHLESALVYDDFDLMSGKMRGRKNSAGNKVAKAAAVAAAAAARARRSKQSDPTALPSVSSLLAARAIAAATYDDAVDAVEMSPSAATHPLRVGRRASKQELHILTKCRQSERREKQLAQCL